MGRQWFWDLDSESDRYKMFYNMLKLSNLYYYCSFGKLQSLTIKILHI